jgi:hypothetical protein
MPAVVISEPPGISCVFSNGNSVGWQMRGTADLVLVGDLLGGLAGLVHPHGPVDAAKTVREYGSVIRAFTLTLAGLGHAGPLAGLSRGRLTEALLGLGHRREMMIRRSWPPATRKSPGRWLARWPRGGRSAGSGPTSRSYLIARLNGSSWSGPADRRRTRQWPRTARLSPSRPPGGIRERMAGPSRTSCGCWPDTVR